jgi:DNA modification methylase
MRSYTDEDAIVFEPFGGSGTVAIACEAVDRRGRLIMELDPAYVDVIVERWPAYTGGQAVLDSDGRGFKQIAAERQG